MVEPADDPNEPADCSRAPPGEVAEVPIDPTNVSVADGNGYLIRWDDAEWLYAEGDSFEELSAYE